MVFFLDEPQIVASKTVKKAAEALSKEQRQLPSRYIPHKNSELYLNNEDMGEWRKRQAGMLYAMRKRRDSMVASLSEEDMTEAGNIADNPLIVKIPARKEIRDELEELLMLM